MQPTRRQALDGSIADNTATTRVSVTPPANTFIPNFALGPRQDCHGIFSLSPLAAMPLICTKCQPKMAKPATAIAKPPNRSASTKTQAAFKSSLMAPVLPRPRRALKDCPDQHRLQRFLCFDKAVEGRVANAIFCGYRFGFGPRAKTSLARGNARVAPSRDAASSGLCA
jgi:hypothetical protein